LFGSVISGATLKIRSFWYKSLQLSSKHTGLREHHHHATNNENWAGQQITDLFCVQFHHFFSQLAQYCLVWLRFGL